MLPEETLEMRKRLLTLSLTKPRKNVETVLKTYEKFISADILYITDLR
jgi:hypothetical protein